MPWFTLSRVELECVPVSDNTEFEAYLTRFQERVGLIDVGQYGRFRDRLVRKLDEVEFKALATQHVSLASQMSEKITNGDTIDESLLLEIRRVEFDLLIEDSKFIL